MSLRRGKLHLLDPGGEERPGVVRARGPPRGGTVRSGRGAPGRRAPRSSRRRATRASPRLRRLGATAKPWFWLVTRTRPVARSSTGWFAPRWPNGSLKVERPVASASSWWPRQTPRSGTRPSSSRTVAVSSVERLRVAGAVREDDAVVARRACRRRRRAGRRSRRPRPRRAGAGSSAWCRSRRPRRAASRVENAYGDSVETARGERLAGHRRLAAGRRERLVDARCRRRRARPAARRARAGGG